MSAARKAYSAYVERSQASDWAEWSKTHPDESALLGKLAKVINGE